MRRCSAACGLRRRWWFVVWSDLMSLEALGGLGNRQAFSALQFAYLDARPKYQRPNQSERIGASASPAVDRMIVRTIAMQTPVPPVNRWSLS